jgi:hypothetical protein
VAGFADHIHDLLNGAPELIDTPGLTTGLAQGINEPASGLVEGQSVGQSAVVAGWAAALKEYAAELAQHGGP